jgi:hypothetical protein
MATAVVESRNGAAQTRCATQEKVFVTPEIASEWLARNEDNRKLIPNHVASLEAVLLRGEWALNGETIKFASSGRLLDGQHRLTACVKSGVGFWTFVVYGLHDATFDTIDTNARPRKASDILSIKGKASSHSLAACVKSLWIFSKTGQFYDGGGGCAGFSPRVCVDVVERRPSLEHFVHATHNNRVFGSQSLMAALSYLFSCVDDSLAADFVGVMNDGSNELARPFNVLREALIGRRMSSVRVGNRPLAFMAIRCWNSELTGDWIKKVYYKPNEDFPLIGGLNYEDLSKYV